VSAVKSWVLAVVLMGYGSAAAALPPPVQIAFSAGRVSVAVADAPVADVLAAWARIGNCELTGAEYLGARRMSLHLTNVAEADALRAIVGAASWYSTVVRDTPEALQSTFQRIAVLPAAATAAAGSRAPAPETRYSYSSDPDADAAAMAQFAQLAAPQPPQSAKRPADVEPEAFYRYTP
jgi:hypothetical protein